MRLLTVHMSRWNARASCGCPHQEDTPSTAIAHFQGRDAAIFTDDRIGASQETTPEGFLLCKDVPIARLGEMLYAPHEIMGVDPGPDGIVRISRNADALFDPVAMASFEGKPVTLTHPDDEVTPENWKEVAVGAVHNVRRGEGANADKLMADLLITDEEAIEAIRTKKQAQVSAGYDADYVPTQRAGYGVQRNIVGNHVALVEKGRCGPSCSIQDKETVIMATKITKKRSFFDRLMARMRANDEEGAREMLEQAGLTNDDDVGGEGEGATININLSGATAATPAVMSTTDEGGAAAAAEPGAVAAPNGDIAKLTELVSALAARLDALEGKQAGGTAASATDADEVDLNTAAQGAATTDDGGEMNEGNGEGDQIIDNGGEGADGGKTLDSASIITSWRDTVSRAEMIMPGVKIPTFDAKLTRQKAVDAICMFRRKTLLQAVRHQDSVAFVKPLLAGRDVRKMTCDSVMTAFMGASELARATRQGSVMMPGNFRHSDVEQLTPSAINQRNREFWNQKH